MDKLGNLQDMKAMYYHSMSLFRIAINTFIDYARDYQKEYTLEKDEIRTAKSFGADFSTPIMIDGVQKYFAITKIKFINNYPYLWGFDEVTGEEISKVEMPSNDIGTAMVIADFLVHVVTGISAEEE